MEGTCTNAFIISKPLLNIHCFADVLSTLHLVISSNKDVISRTKTLKVSVENNNDMILLIIFIPFFLVQKLDCLGSQHLCDLFITRHAFG